MNPEHTDTRKFNHYRTYVSEYLEFEAPRRSALAVSRTCCLVLDSRSSICFSLRASESWLNFQPTIIDNNGSIWFPPRDKMLMLYLQ